MNLLFSVSEDIEYVPFATGVNGWKVAGSIPDGVIGNFY